MQINTKLGLVDIPNEVILAAARDLGASVIPSPEPQGHSSAFAVADGCLPVVEAEAVAQKWLKRSINNNTRAAEHRAAGRNDAATCCETWSAAYLVCADELRQLTVLPSQRQPEDNAASETRGPVAPKTESGTEPRCL